MSDLLSLWTKNCCKILKKGQVLYITLYFTWGTFISLVLHMMNEWRECIIMQQVWCCYCGSSLSFKWVECQKDYFSSSAILLLENFKSWWYIITSGAMGGILLCTIQYSIRTTTKLQYSMFLKCISCVNCVQEYLHTEVSPIKFLPFLCMVFPLAFCVMWKLLGILFPDVTNCQMEIFPLECVASTVAQAMILLWFNLRSSYIYTRDVT